MSSPVPFSPELLKAVARGEIFLDPPSRLVVAAALVNVPIPAAPAGNFVMLLETFPGRTFQVSVRFDSDSMEPIPLRLGVPVNIPWAKRLLISTSAPGTILTRTVLIVTGRNIDFSPQGAQGFPQFVTPQPPNGVESGTLLVNSETAITPTTLTVTGFPAVEPMGLQLKSRGPGLVRYGWGAVAGTFTFDSGEKEYFAADRLPSTAISFIREVAAPDVTLEYIWYTNTKNT